MSPADETRLAEMVSNFIESCGLDLPLHVITISSNGSVAVSRHTSIGVKQICGHRVGPGMLPPIVVTAISEDGVGKSVRITVEAAAPTMQ